jgi:hypothetical protein
MADKCIERGIAKTPHGYRVSVRVQGQQHRQRFPATATLEQMRRWRERRQQKERWGHLRKLPNAKKFRRGPDGFCYLYALRVGEFVKFGRAIDPAERVEELQNAHPERLVLLAAVPAHAHVETLVHARFECHRVSGEWYRLTDEIVEFIDALNDGKNPIALLWDVTLASLRPSQTP